MIDKDNLKYPWMSQFTVNVCRSSRDGHLKSTIREHLIQGRDLATKIPSAFSWTHTPQGHSYWSRIGARYND
jgi:hypothetical protein